MAAGNDTTRYSIAASLYALASRPALVKQLQAVAATSDSNDNEIWALAADELIRWSSPTMHFRRTARRDMELHGKSIKKDDKVILWFVAGNRDETVFENPNEINLSRNPNPHIAFGQGGVHVLSWHVVGSAGVAGVFTRMDIANRLDGVDRAASLFEV